ncbi:hypothetical protein SmJEL517_g05236 [Synchytrium microbalum]|uniref:Non-specific serine/threonine protein kinase n=1 Tax=Synchytrium microbalum TaxID=1806994 RepID=A0A507C1Q3_9FUNG|nr:uncharacterized protein SmJEL517_g05236 [Synchytrium microbalum]TPX31433.1 hypothetical protein SmJEL517_g05236 [Synchytrium microbalum]
MTTATAAAAASRASVDSNRSASSTSTAGTNGKNSRHSIGPWSLLRTLGEGEFGKVKLALHQETGKEAAIKLIKKESIENPTRRAKLLREIAILKAVNHPYIVKLFEVIETDTHIGIVTEFASGGEVFEYILAHRYLKERDACRFFCQLISGVNYLHHSHIVHRDLKLENLLLDGQRNIIITDFGFAHRAEKNLEALLTTSCGSPCYAAPELVISDGYVGESADIWSCGVILYAMLCGYLPFDDDPANPDGDNINLLYKYILETELDFPEYVGSTARSLLKRMLVPDPKRRAKIQEIMAHPWVQPFAYIFSETPVKVADPLMEPESFVERIPSPSPNIDEDMIESSDVEMTTAVPDSDIVAAEPYVEASAITTTTTTTAATTTAKKPTTSKDSTYLSREDSSLEDSKRSSVDNKAATTTTIASITNNTSNNNNPVAPPRSTTLLPIAATASSVAVAVGIASAVSSTSSTTTNTNTSTTTSSAINSSISSVPVRKVPPPVVPAIDESVSKKKRTSGVLKPNVVSPIRNPQIVTDELEKRRMSAHYNDSDAKKARRDVQFKEGGAGASEAEPTFAEIAATRKSFDVRKLVNGGTELPGKPPQRGVSWFRRRPGPIPIPEDEAPPPLPTPIPPLPRMSMMTARTATGPIASSVPSQNLPPPRQTSVPQQQQTASSIAAIEASQPRYHYGVIDRRALTSKQPRLQIAEIKAIVASMGLEVTDDKSNEYKVKCIRRQRPMTSDNSSMSSVADVSNQQPQQQQSNTSRTPTRKPSRVVSIFPFSFLRRQSKTNNSSTTSVNSQLQQQQTIDAQLATVASEVRFSIEVQRLRNLPGLYVVDFERSKGDRWLFRKLYDDIVTKLDLKTEGAAISIGA